jgi:hypothetical protein
MFPNHSDHLRPGAGLFALALAATAPLAPAQTNSEVLWWIGGATPDIEDMSTIDAADGGRRTDLLTCSGPLHVYSGISGALRANLPSTLTSFRAVVARLGDLDADGVGEFAHVAPLDGVGGTGGIVTVYSGSTRTLLFTLTGNQDDKLGRAVADAGDTDADGVHDVIVGASSSASGRGRALIVSGRTRQVLQTLTGVAVDGQFGWAVASLGDIDGDGCSDVAVGAPADGDGKVFAFSGRSGTLLWRADAPPTSWFGRALVVTSSRAAATCSSKRATRGCSRDRTGT